MKPILTSLIFAVFALGCGGSSTPANTASPSNQAQPPEEETACLEGQDCDDAPIGGEAQGPDQTQACTDEAMLCSDGSAVGRTGPNCEFAACPDAGGDAAAPGGATVCTADVKQCPDGSTVSRSHPNCEFAACP